MLSPDAESTALRQFEHAYAERDSRFGNARFARNMFERAITSLATRIANVEAPDRPALMRIEALDLAPFGASADAFHETTAVQQESVRPIRLFPEGDR
jgi:hypothetical protein